MTSASACWSSTTTSASPGSTATSSPAEPASQRSSPCTRRAARAAVRDDAPDLLLVDAYLPDGDGIALVRELDVDAFVLSAATDAATVRRALRAGALA